jgi:polyphenol oxidase
MITAPNLENIPGLVHGFGLRDSIYPPGIRTVRQIHSSIVIDAAEIDAERPTEGDALISNTPGVIVGVKTADCVPILLVDPSTHAVAAIHAGWRGTAGNIVERTINDLCVRWRTRPRDIQAAIGPSIGPCCYQVGPDVARRFEIWLSELGQMHGPAFLDLPAINEIQLRQAGVSGIWKSGECTFCRAEKFFSFRREREQAGRMLSFIGWQKYIGRTS